MSIAITSALIMYGVAAVISLLVALMIKGLYSLIRRFDKSSR